MHRGLAVTLCAVLLLLANAPVSAQTVTATIQGQITDPSGAAIPRATVTATNSGTGLTRSALTSDVGTYQIAGLPVGDYMIAVEQHGFRKATRRMTLQIGDSAVADFKMDVGAADQEVSVTDETEGVEPGRTTVSMVVDERQIENLPVNGRQFIDFALLAPGVTVGDTTSGSTDVIIEPVTKLSFNGQNIHYNFIAIDGADNISTASGIQKTTPSQEAVREFRVINTTYSTEAGRAVGGIVNIVTKSGTNDLHGSVYEYFRNDALDARSALASPGLNKLRQNQYGATLGGPIRRDRTFFFGNYEGQRRRENPFYNSIILKNLAAINQVKTNVFHLAPENLNVTRNTDYDNLLLKLDHTITPHHYLSARYFFNDQRATNLSPLNDGFDLPSGFKNNNFRDQSLVASLTSTLSNSLVNDLRFQYAHRYFNFPTVSTQPHLEVSNTFTLGVNRGNPDFYEEGRAELIDNVTKAWGRHTLSFGGDFNHVNTTESFPLFYPFEADFASLDAFLGKDCLFGPAVPSLCNVGPHPFVIFFERFNAANGFNETSISPSAFNGTSIPAAVRNQAKGELGHTYEGLYFEDKWRMRDNLTVNYGLRWQGETWPSAALNNPLKQFDPRAGLAWNVGGKRNLVVRAGGGLFHGTIPSPLLMCQIPSCGGVNGAFPGRTNEDSLNATTRLSAFGADALSDLTAFNAMMKGTYPAQSQDAVIVRFAKNHKPPYGAQASLGVEFQPTQSSILDVSFMHERGIHLGSFYNVNQPNPTEKATLHNSSGAAGTKDLYWLVPSPPGVPPDAIPTFRNPAYAVYFEADSRWDSVWDGLLVNFKQRTTHHVGGGISYTFAKGIDNGPNPSFVLIPQDSAHFDRERAVSSDDVKHRFVMNGFVEGPKHTNALVNDFQLGLILTLESPHYFTKFAGSDVNGDVFGNNDRVGVEGRNTFKGDNYRSLDARLSRVFKMGERMQLEGDAEAFNLLNTLNVRFFNTAYGAADFCNFNATASGCDPAHKFLEGSPNPNYGTPRAIFNPRQVQFALKLTF